jgi:hypothetical protein
MLRLFLALLLLWTVPAAAQISTLTLAQGGTGSATGLTVTTQGGSYTAASTDCGTMIVFSATATVTLPSTLGLGCRIQLMQGAASAPVTASAGSGATLQNPYATAATAAQYAIAEATVTANAGGSAAAWTLRNPVLTSGGATAVSPVTYTTPGNYALGQASNTSSTFTTNSAYPVTGVLVPGMTVTMGSVTGTLGAFQSGTTWGFTVTAGTTATNTSFTASNFCIGTATTTSSTLVTSLITSGALAAGMTVEIGGVTGTLGTFVSGTTWNFTPVSGTVGTATAFYAGTASVISTADAYSLINSASPGYYLLTPGTNGIVHTISNYGAGTATIVLSVNGATATVSLLQGSTIVVFWNSSLSTYLYAA